MNIIGLCGEMGSGKNWFASNVVSQIFKEHRYIEIAFADFLKVECMLNNPQHVSDYLKPTKTLKIRKQLQAYGAQQRALDPDIWVKKAKYYMQLQQAKGGKPILFCITDVRFENEIKFIKEQKGILIKLYAPKRTQARRQQENNTGFMSKWWSTTDTSQDSSEKIIRELSDSTYNLVVNNDINDALNVKDISKFLETCFK